MVMDSGEPPYRLREETGLSGKLKLDQNCFGPPSNVPSPSDET